MDVKVTPTTSKFGIRMSQRMNELRINDTTLARLTLLDMTAIRLVRRSSAPNPTLNTLIAICKALDISLDYLVFGK